MEREGRPMNMTVFPAPLVPTECDLRNFSFMPLDVVRLRDSDLAAIDEPEAFRSSVIAWCVAWHQTPAASLPDDDRTLARLLGYGRDIAGWQQIRKAGGLHGFIRCSDGRLYHPVVAEKAREAWEKKAAQKDRTEAARQAKLAKSRQEVLDYDQSFPKPFSVTEPVTESVTGSKDRTGEERKKEESVRQTIQTPVPRAEVVSAEAVVIRWSDPVPMAEPEPEPVSLPMPEPESVQPAVAEPESAGPVLATVNGVEVKPDWSDLGCGDIEIEAKTGKKVVNGTYLDGAWADVIEAAAIDESRFMGTDKPLRNWLNEGFESDQLVTHIRKIASRPGYKPPNSLEYFTKTLRLDVKPSWHRAGTWGKHAAGAA
jgi:hypothetical protein